MEISTDLKELQYQITEMENYKTEEDIIAAQEFFKQVLSSGLVFRKASGEVVSKKKFKKALKLPNKMISREIQGDIKIELDEKTQSLAWVEVIIAGQKETGKEPESFRNLRQFTRGEDGFWQLRAWHNTKI